MWTLFWSFFKMGSLMFGGGYSMLPLLQREVVEKHKWVTEDEVLNYFAVGQCTPGVIAVNTATFVGHKIRGVMGGIVATLGVITPSIIIIITIAALLNGFWDEPIVIHAFNGVRAAVAALIAAAVIRLARSNIKSIPQIVIAVIAFVIVAILGWSPAYVAVGAALVGMYVLKGR